jgi:hypothetical protein
MDEDIVWGVLVERQQSKPRGFLSRRPAGDNAHILITFSDGIFIKRRISVRESTASPPIRRYCFGPSVLCPARSPRPAATMTAAAREMSIAFAKRFI